MTQDNSNAQTLVAYIFALLPVAFAIGVTGLFGGQLSTFFPEMSFSNGFWAMNLFAGTGWLIFVIFVFALMPESMKTDYLGYLFPTVLVPGLFLLLPYMLFHWLAPTRLIAIPLTFMVISLLVMFYRHHQKLKFLRLPLKWYFAWIACLALPAIGWFWYFQNVKGWI